MITTRFITLFLTLALFSSPAYATCGARGFGTTFGLGTTDSIATGYTTTPAASFSISAWFFRNGAGGGNLGRIIDQNSATPTAQVLIDDNSASLAGSMAFQYGQAVAPAKWHWTTPSSNVWHHLVVTFNSGSASNAPIVYIDGATVSITTDAAYTASGNTQTTGTYNIGNRADGIRNWDGELADVAYWNAILTANEAFGLHKGVSPLKIRPASLQIYLPLCGIEPNEPDWASHLTQTIVGTKGVNGDPVQPFPMMTGGQ